MTDSNYLIRKVGTNYTQIVHRIRLRPIKLQYQVKDIDEINSDNFQTDPTLGHYRGEQDLFDHGLPSLLDNDRIAAEKEIPNFDSPVRVSIYLGTTSTSRTNHQPTRRRTCDSRTVNNYPSSKT